MRPVGILGGMGPEATILLMQKILAAVPDARDDADHIPLIVHQNPQVPSRIRRLIEGQGDDPGPVLQAMAQGLHAAGATALAMPCNTAHHYADTIRAATPLPFLDMRYATAARLGGMGAHRVGMLASPALRLTGAFDAALGQAGMVPVYLDPDDAILAMIRAIKAGTPPDRVAPDLIAAAQRLSRLGADHLLVACTELSLVAPFLPAGLLWVDSLDCLVKAIADHARGN